MKKFLFVLFVFVSAVCFATHNRAGEITYKRIPPYTEEIAGITVAVYNYSITIITYTDFGNSVADRCEDTVYFGDGQRVNAPRINGTSSSCNCGNATCGEIIIAEPNHKVKKNIYTTTHRYANAGTYLIRMGDPNRNDNVYNIPNSVNQPFYIEALLVINNYSGANSSPMFNYDPIDVACRGKCFYHNPGAYDPDNDSLSYEFTTPRGTGGNPIAGYTYPNPGAGGQFSIDNEGLITWCNPQFNAEYNIAFIVKEWRKNTNGIYEVVGYVLRDMQVIVQTCPINTPPLIITPPDTCVEAGALIEKKIMVSDTNSGDYVVLEGKGGAFSVSNSAATLNNTAGTMTSANEKKFSANFRWQTTCDHIRQQPYAMVFKATDNGSRNFGNEDLIYFATYNIRVLPPSVKNVTATPLGSTIKITWSPIACNPATNPLTSYKIYRKDDCSPFTYTPCLTGVPATSGFSNIAKVNTSETFFTDNNNGNGLVVGQNYSYLVVGVYADGTETYGGSAVCTKLKRDAPLLLNVDVKSTSETNGAIYVRWARPLIDTTLRAYPFDLFFPTNFDTLTYIGPYRFILKYRIPASGSNTFTEVQTFSHVSFLKLDTEFIHTNVNTKLGNIEYIVEFEAQSFPITTFSVKPMSAARTATDLPFWEVYTYTSTSQVASSVFLKTEPSDRRIDLSWTANTPWKNKSYAIWRKNAAGYEFLATTTKTNYVDTNNIANRHTYCYKVVSTGEYSDTTIYKPLINTSQESCTVPIDLTPPCVPTLSMTANCPDMQEGGITISNNGSVRLIWNDVRLSYCGDDVVRYDLYYKPTPTDQYQPIAKGLFNFYINDTLEYISGCYAVQVADSSGNLSPMSLDFCIDNCPIFELPNVFTPNNDNVNDFFHAIRVRQIKKINLFMYDRWGNLVYETNDPYFKWDGISRLSQQPLSDGTLFYVCDVYEPRLRGLIKRTLKGYVELVR